MAWRRNHKGRFKPTFVSLQDLRREKAPLEPGPRTPKLSSHIQDMAALEAELEAERAGVQSPSLTCPPKPHASGRKVSAPKSRKKPPTPPKKLTPQQIEHRQALEGRKSTVSPRKLDLGRVGLPEDEETDPPMRSSNSTSMERYLEMQQRDKRTR